MEYRDLVGQFSQLEVKLDEDSPKREEQKKHLGLVELQS
jgi:hypothetical protein